MACNVPPRIGAALETLGNGFQGKSAGCEAPVGKLLPGKRSSYRCAGARPHGIRRHRGLAVGIAHDVQIEAAAALRPAPLGRELFRIPGGDEPGDVASARTHRACRIASEPEMALRRIRSKIIWSGCSGLSARLSQMCGVTQA